MGERKGQNFYYPPDFDYRVHKNLNKYHGTHALRERAAKIKEGILIIRFEMPFNIWCLGCNNHVGMGVRYNAEKKKVGMYYTTPVYEFRMRCHLCTNYFVIRTDPEHFDYELVEGCRRQEKRYDPSTIDQLGAVDRSFNLRLEGDKMFKMEHAKEDVGKLLDSGDQMEKLEWIQDRMRDDFAANQALRRAFRKDKHDLKETRIRDDDLRKRTSLDISLLPENEDDRNHASLIMAYRNIKPSGDQSQEVRDGILNRPIFDGKSRVSPSETPSTSTDSSASPASFSKHLPNVSLKRKIINDPFGKPSQSLSIDQESRKSLGIVLRRNSCNGQSLKSSSQLKDTSSPADLHSATSEGMRNTVLNTEVSHDSSVTNEIDDSSSPNASAKFGNTNLSSPFHTTSKSLVADYGSGSSTDSSE